jgi:uncharacterized protein (TIRG00374 family)
MQIVATRRKVVDFAFLNFYAHICRVRIKVKSSLITLLKFIFSAGVITWLVESGKFDFASLIHLLQPSTLLIAIALTVTNLILCNERWLCLLQAKGIHLSRMAAWRLTTIGSFFNFVVPGGVGGDVIKGYYIAREHPSQRLDSVITVAMDRLIGLYTMVLMAIFVMLSNWQQVIGHSDLLYIFYFLFTLGIVFSIFWGVVFSQRLSGLAWLDSFLQKIPHGHRVFKLLKSFSTYAKEKRIFFKTLLISFFAQCFSVFLFIFISSSLGYSNVPFSTYFFVVPIGFMITAIPISPAGIGIGQAAFYYLFNLALGTKSSLGATTVTAFQCLQFLTGLMGAWYYITVRKELVIPAEDEKT